MQGFVGRIGHDETKTLYMYRQFVSSTNSYAWRRDSTITFQRFASGIKVTYRNAASEVYSEFIYVEGHEVRVSVYFVKLELLLVLTCYACMH